MFKLLGGMRNGDFTQFHISILCSVSSFAIYRKEEFYTVS